LRNPRAAEDEDDFVRPRKRKRNESEEGAAAALQGTDQPEQGCLFLDRGCGEFQSDARGREAGDTDVVSPLIGLLEEGRNTVPATVVRGGPKQATYTGFAYYHSLLLDAKCTFVSMASNRTVNEDVVALRVGTNLRRKADQGEYCDFGQLVLLVYKLDIDPVFYIMDGQHRFQVPESIHYPDTNPTRDLNLDSSGDAATT